MAEPKLRVVDLACRRGDRRIFEQVSFELAPGEALQIEGPNGAGKSSLLRLLAGLLDPDAGSIDNPFEVAWMGHDIALKPGMTLAAELHYWAQLDDRGAAAVDAALARFDLAPLAELPCGILSSGQRRRAALARASLSAARLWLFDEPAVGLDSRSQQRLATVLAEHRGGGGMVVAVTHVDLGLATPQRLQLGA